GCEPERSERSACAELDLGAALGRDGLVRHVLREAEPAKGREREHCDLLRVVDGDATGFAVNRRLDVAVIDVGRPTGFVAALPAEERRLPLFDASLRFANRPLFLGLVGGIDWPRVELDARRI